MRRNTRVIAPLAVLLGAAITLGGCSSMHNYVDTRPVFRGGQAAARAPSDEIRVVTFNIKFGERFRLALEEIRASPDLADGDIFLFQEVHEAAVDSLASGLGCEYVYYPISRHSKHGKNFGNAVLVRGTIRRHDRVLAPHRNWLRGQRRGATIAAVTVRGHDLTVVSAHTGTAVMGLQRRLDQVGAICDAVADIPGPVLVGGDFNVISDPEADALDRVFEVGGMTWLSADARFTAPLRLGLRATLDLIYGRGLRHVSSGVVRHTESSDHHPVWAVLEIG